MSNSPANSSSQTIDSAWAEYRETLRNEPRQQFKEPRQIFGLADLEAAFRAGAAAADGELRVRLMHCEMSLNLYDEGHDSEYWVRHEFGPPAKEPQP